MRHRDFIQNIAITLLAVSALFLFSRTQFFQLSAASVSNYWQRITTPASSATDDVILSDTLSAPVRAAVTGEYGRYASVTLTTGEDRFIPIKTLLREVLGSARNRTDSTQAAFLEALGKTSVYCDFLSSLPAAYLADLMGLSTDSSLSIRALAAVEEKGQVILLLWDGGSHYYQCATAVQTSTLTEVLDHFELGVSTFAFEDSSGYGQRLSPLSLFPDPLPELPQLTLSAASVPTETLLSALGFNPHTNSRYQDASGAFSYTSGGEAALSIDASGTEPTVREAVTGVQSLLDALTPEGEARLYLLSLTQNGSEATLTFGYQLGGVPIRFADGSPAAEVTLSGRAVSSLALTPRQYTSEAAAALLPLRQAMAIAGKDGGTELSIGYADTGAYPISAVWLAD